MAPLRKALFIAATSMAVIAGALLPATAWPENHVVGDYHGWEFGVDYQNWSLINDGIPVGNTLEFIFDPAFYNVVSVNEDNYNRCIVPNNAPTWNTGDDKIQLMDVGKYFFICGLDDHCTRGMKFAITAV